MSSNSSGPREGLRFFGKVSASVSHEIKNVFAVINEAAGLIGDFTLMAEKGMPIDPEKLQRTAKSIQGQIQRGDTIIKNMNALAHSTDEDVREVELTEILTLIVALSTRMADMKQMSLEVGDCEPTALHVSPFDVMQLLHGMIAATLETLSQGDVLTMTVKPETDGAVFTLSVPGRTLELTNDSAVTNMVQQMNATVANNKDNGFLELRLGRTV